MKEYEHVVYSINVEDIQTVAMEEYGRILTDEELEVIEDNLGDYIRWHDIIEMVISNHLKISPKMRDVSFGLEER